MSAAKPSWRDFYAVHPVCEVFPPLGPDELQKLADDIDKNGLKVAMQTRHVAGPDGGTTYVIDGRNRLAALEDILGYQIVNEKGDWIGSAKVEHLPGRTHEQVAAEVVGLNIRRRHLSKQEQVALIDKALNAADNTESVNITLSVRDKAGKLRGSTKGHTGKVVEIAKQAGVSESTVKKALAKQKTAEPTPRPTQQKPLPKHKPLSDAEKIDKRLNKIIDEVHEIEPPQSEFGKVLIYIGKQLQAEGQRLRCVKQG